MAARLTDGSPCLQVLVSLQAMVFCSDPFFNEPGEERWESTAQGHCASERYNKSVRLQTARLAMLAPLKQPRSHPHGVFHEVLQQHWRAKKTAITAQLHAWGIEDRLVRDIEAALLTT